MLKNSLKGQNALLLAANYFFYAWWDVRFLFLLIFHSALTFFLARSIHQTHSERKRKWLLGIGLAQGLGALIAYKYLAFLIETLNDLAAGANLSFHMHSPQWLLPLGISFYTFRTISYLLDVDKGKTEPVRSWVTYFNFVSFFPSLISGPIDKAKLLVPQLERQRTFDHQKASDGLRQILWGLFKKIVIADNCATITNFLFREEATLPGSALLLGALLYSIQIYADFSGYSDMAIGVARMIGFNITRNFEYPFFAQNIAEFWRRWHMSLTNWLTEYVFTPLTITFRNLGDRGLILAIIINFTVIGIWHGANWTFVLFGFLHGCLYIPLILKGKLNKRKKIDKGKMLPSPAELFNILSTFFLVSLLFLIFRANSISHALHIFKQILSPSLFRAPIIEDPFILGVVLLSAALMLTTEWIQRDKEHALQIDPHPQRAGSLSRFRAARWTVYATLLLFILCFAGKGQDFIYFKF